MYPFTANAAPVNYNMGAQQDYGTSYSGYPVQPTYGTVQYPPAGQYANYSQPVQPANYSQSQHGAQTYTGLDAAVYSAATAMLAERGLNPAHKAQSSNYAAQNLSGPSSTNWKSRVEQMNPTTPASTSAPSTRGGAAGRGARGSFRGGRGSFGGPGRGFPVKPKDPANQAQHYCEVCKISCAGVASFQAHMVGAKHKRREQQAKEQVPAAVVAAPAAGIPAPPPPPGPPRHQPHGRQIMCELCGVSTAGHQAYEAHINGKSHQRTLKLHMKLGKYIPANEPTITQRTVPTIGQPTTSGPSTGSSICTKVVTGGKTVLITPKMNFVGGTVLTSTAGGMQEVQAASHAPPAPPPAAPFVAAAPAPPPPRAPPKPKNAIKHVVNPNTTGANPIGQEYVQKLEREGKVAYYKCTLCDCEFSDESGMNSHIRGRRHRTSYQKKVDPTIVVEPSNAQKKAKERTQRLTPRPPPPPRLAKRPPPPGPSGSPKRMRRPMPGQGPPPPQWRGGPPPPGPPSGYEPYPLHHEHYGPPHPQGPHPSPPRGLLGHYPRYPEPPGPMPFVPLRGGGLLPPPTEPPLRFPHPAERQLDFDSISQSSVPDTQPSPPRPPPAQMNQARLDQQYLLHKHRAITPKGSDLDVLNGMLVHVEKALKTVADKLMFPIAESKLNGEVQDVKPPITPQRMLKGAYRFGRMSKNLLTNDQLSGEVLLICNRHPTEEDMMTVARALTAELKTNHPERVYAVIPTPDKCGIFVKEESAVKNETAENGEHAAGSFPVWVYMAFGSLRDELAKMDAEKANAAGSIKASESGATTPLAAPPCTEAQPAGSDATGPTGGVPDGPATTTVVTVAASPAADSVSCGLDAVGALDLKRSLTVLAHSRRTRWFQEFIAFFPQCRMLMRILNHMFEHNEELRELSGWPVEFLTITVLRTQAAYHGITPADIPLAEAFWLIVSTISSGCFLPGCPNGFKDPCERGPIDILGDVNVEERVKLTRGTAELLNRWLTGEYARVLDVEPLPGDPLHPPVAEVVPMEGVMENGRRPEAPDFATDTMLC